MLRRRITFRSSLAAMPAFAVAVVFLGAHVFDRKWATPRQLELALTYELLLIHAFAFLGAAAFARPKRWWTRILRGIAFFGLLAMYCGAAHMENGWWGVATLFGLGLATYTGLFFRLHDEKVTVELGTRWLVNMITLVFVVGVPVGLWIAVVEGRSAPRITEEPALGIGYFFLLGCYELFRLYDGLIKHDRVARTDGQSSSMTA